MTDAGHQDPFDTRENPVDPALSADVGHERRRWVLPLSIAIALAIVAGAWWAFTPHGPKPPQLTFENKQLDCRFTYSSQLTAGPNYLRAASGSVMTIERHSLYEAKKEFLEGLPDVLVSQVLIQINESYTDVSEVSRTPLTIDGKKAVEVVFRGKPKTFKGPARIVITVFANADWVYVVRSYTDENGGDAEEAMFREAVRSWRFLS